MSYSDPLFSWSQVSFRYTLLISTSWLLFPFWMWMSNLHLKLHNKTVHRLHVTRRKILHDFWCWGFRFLEAKGRKTVFSDQSVPPGGLETKAQRLCSISETWIALKRHILFFCFYILGPKTNAMCTSINFLLSVKEWKTRLQLWHSDDLTKEGKKNDGHRFIIYCSDEFSLLITDLATLGFSATTALPHINQYWGRVSPAV